MVITFLTSGLLLEQQVTNNAHSIKSGDLAVQRKQRQACQGMVNFAEPTNTTIRLTTYKVLAVVQPGKQLESCMESTEA